MTLNYPSNTGLPGETKSGDLLVETISNVMLFLVVVVACLAIISFVVSGIMYILSAGNQERMESAKKGLYYSIIGTVVAGGSGIILFAINAWLSGSSTF